MTIDRRHLLGALALSVLLAGPAAFAQGMPGGGSF